MRHSRLRSHYAMAGTIRIGTSGWHYAGWKNVFYPPGLPTGRWLEHYAQTFDTVEINNSFHNMPRPETMNSWRDQTPPGFTFAVKANRYITHLRKLKGPYETLTQFLELADRLKSRLGPILYQLPPHWKQNLERLAGFAEQLPSKYTHVVEFRERDWLGAETYALMERNGLALCVHDLIARHPRRVTGPIAYVRFHGTHHDYSGGYSRSRLQGWAKWIREVAATVDVYAYFNNDIKGHAVRNALTLRELTA